MNKGTYKFGMYLLGLSLVCGFLQAFIYFQLGGRMYSLQPFADWFLVFNIIAIAGTFFLLKYLHFRQFRVALLSGTIVALTGLCHFIILYFRLILVARELDIYASIALLFTLSAGIVFASNLIFSTAGKRAWLRMAGFVILPTNLVLLAALIWSNMFRDIYMYGTVEKIAQWVFLSGSVVPGFFIMNFIRELGLLEADEVEVHATRKESVEGLVGLAGLIALVFVLFFGSQLLHHSIWASGWMKDGPEKAQELATSFETRTFVSSKGDTLKYLFLQPLNYDPSRKYPLVVCLHGGPIPIHSDRARHAEVPEPAPLLSQEANREKYPAFIFVPQGPPGHSWGGFLNFPSVDSLVFETIGALEQEFEIDQNRRYVAGGSLGGYGAWYFIATRPEMFAAAIPFCGGGNPALAKKMAGVPVWAFHGDEDRSVSVRGSRNMIAAIRKAGGNPRYTEFAGVGHNVWPEVSKTPGLLDWLFAQKRD